MRTSRSVLAVAALLGSALSAEAKPPSYPYGFASRMTESRDRKPAIEAGLIVTREPDSGTLRPATAEESARFFREVREAMARNRSTEGLRVVTLKDGSKMVDLEDRFMSFTVAKKAADGTVTQGCIEDAADAAAFVKPEERPATALEER